jgi:excisionase family DNA binding protein
MVKEGEGITKEVLTAEDLARYLGFNRNWIYRQAEAGELPGVKLGKSWRFKRSVIDRWLEERILSKPKAESEAGVEARVKAKAEEELRRAPARGRRAPREGLRGDQEPSQGCNPPQDR